MAFLQIITDNILPLLIFVAIGYFMDRRFRLDVNSLTKLTFYIILPCFIFYSIYVAKIDFSLFHVFIISLVLMAMLGAIGTLIAKARNWDAGKREAFKNGTMFSSLTGYLQPGYYEQHPTLALFTPQAAYTIRVFAGYVAAPDSDAWRRAFSSQQEFLQWCEAAARRSAFDSGLMPQPGQRVVTLSTCSYEFENARFVLLGILEQTSQ